MGASERQEQAIVEDTSCKIEARARELFHVVPVSSGNKCCLGSAAKNEAQLEQALLSNAMSRDCSPSSHITTLGGISLDMPTTLTLRSSSIGIECFICAHT